MTLNVKCVIVQSFTTILSKALSQRDTLKRLIFVPFYRRVTAYKKQLYKQNKITCIPNTQRQPLSILWYIFSFPFICIHMFFCEIKIIVSSPLQALFTKFLIKTPKQNFQTKFSPFNSIHSSKCCHVSILPVFKGRKANLTFLVSKIKTHNK